MKTTKIVLAAIAVLTSSCIERHFDDWDKVEIGRRPNRNERCIVIPMTDSTGVDCKGDTIKLRP